MSALLTKLMEETGLSEQDVLRVISTAPIRYKSYKIPKRNGGSRLVSQPAREVKALQRILLKEYLSDLPVHPAATAYRPGMSIRDNALAHVNNGPILKLDFEKFFPSIKAKDWHAYCDARGLFKDEREREQSSQILFCRETEIRGLRLAIGAPSSPHLSNILMHTFDAEISRLAQSDFVTYTRYADDLTFSAKRTGYLVNIEKFVRKTIRNLDWPRLKLNEEKTVLATTRYHRQVTGLVLSNDKKVSLGRDRKRELSSAIHRAKYGKLNSDEIARLAGMLAFVKAVEPQFLDRMILKYGPDTINLIKFHSV